MSTKKKIICIFERLPMKKRPKSPSQNSNEKRNNSSFHFRTKKLAFHFLRYEIRGKKIVKYLSSLSYPNKKPVYSLMIVISDSLSILGHAV